MRSEPTITVRCDGKDCYSVLQVSGHPNLVEEEMEKAGWSVGWGPKDYCQACRVSDLEEGE